MTLRSLCWRWLSSLTVLVTLLLAAYAARGVITPALGHWLDVGEPPVHVDWLLVLPGDYETRPYAAAELYKAGYASQILLPATNQDPYDYDLLLPNSHEIMRIILRARGVSDSAIVVLNGKSDSTRDDAQALANALADSPGRKVAIVTNDYHTRRARLVFQSVLSGSAAELHVFSVPTDRFSADTWWDSREGFVVYSQEYAKLLVYWFRYGTGIWWLAGMLVLLLVVRRVRRRAGS